METEANAEPKKVTDNPAFQPSTLFLTWQRDPTTTMTVQWIGVSGETADTNIQFVKLSETAEASAWQSQKTATKPYPLTDFKVFRAAAQKWMSTKTSAHADSTEGEA